MVAVPSIVQQALAAKPPSLEAALFRAGQVLNALVLGQTPEGLTQLGIGTLTLTAQLPDAPLPGTVLQLAVRASGSPLQLAIVSQKPPATSPALPTAPGQLLLPEIVPVGAVPPPVTSNAQQIQSAVAQSSGAESTSAAPASGVPVRVVGEVAGRAALVPDLPTAARLQVVTAEQAAPSTPPATAPPPSFVQQPAHIVAPTVPSGTTLVVAATPPAALATAEPRSPPAMAVPPPVSPVEPAQVTPPFSTRDPAAPPAGAPVPAGKTAVPAPNSPQITVLAGSGATAPTAATAPSVTSPPAGAGVPTAPKVEASVPGLQNAAPMPTTPAAAAPSPPALQPLPAQAAPLAASSQSPLAATIATLPAGPQEALARMIPVALSQHGSIGTLLQALATLAARGTILPEPVARAAAQVLAGRVPAEAGRLTGPVLKAAVEQSGVLLEAGLARSAPFGSDGKAALLELKSALSTWLGGDPGAVAPARKAPPPVKGAVPRAQLPEMPILPDAPRDLGRALHGHAEAALSRLKLLQLASLPDSSGATRPGGPELRLELPLMFGPELAMLHLQISRDGRRRDRAQQRGWTMRFALNSAATGEVGAEIALLGRAISVALWAAEPETAKTLEADLPQLAERLSAIGLDPGAIRFRRGTPDAAAPASGQLLERVS